MADAPIPPPGGERPTGPTRAVGRMLRIMRLLSAMSAADVASSAGLGLRHVRDLEAGAAGLDFSEGLVLTKTYQLCMTCFIRHYRAAKARGGGLPEEDGDDRAD